MKKWMIVVVVLVVILAFTLGSCSFFKQTLFPLDTPEIMDLGSVLYWNKIEDAEYYELYANGEKLGDVKNNYYDFGELKNDTTFYVIAMSSDNKSKESNSITINKTQNDVAGTLCVSLSTITEETIYSVPTNITKLIIEGSTDKMISFKIVDRVSNLIIELNNASFTAPKGESCIYTPAENATFATTIIVSGENSLFGGQGVEKDPPATNTELKGYAGGNGGHGISLKKISIVGNGSLTLVGGNGGNGSKGADSAGDGNLLTGFNPGDGGNGGNGGSAINATHVALAMGINGSIRMTAGDGGKGGSYGVNGDAMTGIWNNIGGMYYGKDGTKPESYIGEFIQISGNYFAN